MGLPDSENRVELGHIVSEIYSFQKRHWPAGRSYPDLSVFKKELAPRFALRS